MTCPAKQIAHRTNCFWFYVYEFLLHVVIYFLCGKGIAGVFNYPKKFFIQDE